MKTAKANVRKLHVGKSSQEKYAYQNFLNQDSRLDQTAPKQKPFENTDSSTYEKDNYKEVKSKQKKSITLKIKDFFKDNWVSGIGIAVAGALLLIVLGIWTDQKAFIEKNSNLEKRINDNESNIKSTQEKIISIDKEFNGFSISVGKDLEYIKRALGIIENDRNNN